MLLLLIAGFLYFFAILLLFARSLLLLSNVAPPLMQLFFLAGLYFFIGFAGLFKFFVKKGTYGAMAGKVKGSLVYFLGLLLIVGNMGFFGAVAQLAGIVMIFRAFLPDLYDYVCRVPVVGKYLSIPLYTQRAIGCRTRWRNWQGRAIVYERRWGRK